MMSWSPQNWVRSLGERLSRQTYLHKTEKLYQCCKTIFILFSYQILKIECSVFILHKVCINKLPKVQFTAQNSILFLMRFSKKSLNSLQKYMQKGVEKHSTCGLWSGWSQKVTANSKFWVNSDKVNPSSFSLSTSS